MYVHSDQIITEAHVTDIQVTQLREKIEFHQASMRSNLQAAHEQSANFKARLGLFGRSPNTDRLARSADAFEVEAKHQWDEMHQREELLAHVLGYWTPSWSTTKGYDACALCGEVLPLLLSGKCLDCEGV